MALRKAMILVGALLLVTTFQKRIQQASELMPEPQEMLKHAGDRNTEELSEASVEEAEATAEAEPWAELAVEDEQAAASREDMERTLKSIQQGEVFSKSIQQAYEAEGKKDKGKDKGRVKGKDKGTDDGKDAGKAKENKLVKVERRSGEAKGKIISKGGERPDRRVWLPVLDGKWWITRLAFAHGQFGGFIYQEMPGTKTLLIKSWKALQEFGGEVIIPLWGNYGGAKVGDKISFDVASFAQEGEEGKQRPMATNVIIRQRANAIGKGLVNGPAPTDVRTQILYYISDENLRKDKFFQDIIATSEGGWISTDFLLLCRRLQQLGATKKSIIECLQDAPGVEVRDTPGQEAVRRTSPPPPLDAGADAKPGAANAIAKRSAEAPVVSKKIYTTEMMKLVGDLTMKKYADDAGPTAKLAD